MNRVTGHTNALGCPEHRPPCPHPRRRIRRHLRRARAGEGTSPAAPTLEVTLVTRDNFFLFTPMLHEVAASDLELSTIVNPLRKLLRRGEHLRRQRSRRIDLDARRVQVVARPRRPHATTCRTISWSWRSARARTSSACPASRRCALTVKSLGDAVALRNRLITHLEEANSECAAGARQPLLTVRRRRRRIRGRRDTRRDQRLRARGAALLSRTCARTTCAWSWSRRIALILPELGPKLGAYAQRKLAARGVEIITGVKVRGVERRRRRADRRPDDRDEHADLDGRHRAESAGGRASGAEARRARSW